MAGLAVDAARAQREKEVENALATVRMEGLEPSKDAHEIFQLYIGGGVTLQEMGRAIDQLLDREYGPVRLSGNERS